MKFAAGCSTVGISVWLSAKSCGSLAGRSTRKVFPDLIVRQGSCVELAEKFLVVFLELSDPSYNNCCQCGVALQQLRLSTQHGVCLLSVVLVQQRNFTDITLFNGAWDVLKSNSVS